jgi:hypothetical protein
MQKWEYQRLTAAGFDPQTRNRAYRVNGTLQEDRNEPATIVDVLNGWGQQGWEVVAAYPDDDCISFLLKRPIG